MLHVLAAVLNYGRTSLDGHVPADAYGSIRALLVTCSLLSLFPSDSAGFEFLGGGFVDLGFEHLGLAAPELDAVRLAFVGSGVRVPGTSCRLRSLRPGRSVVEPVAGDESGALPARWRQAILVVPTARAGDA